MEFFFFFFFSSRRRHTRCGRDWSSDVCSSDLTPRVTEQPGRPGVTEQHRSSDAEPGAENHHALPPREHARPIIVEALVNQSVAVPLLLDTGATYTILTKQTAQKLGITALDRLPTRRFL